MRKMIKKGFSFLLLLPFLLGISNASAHCLWLNIDNRQPDKGQPISVEIGWGHSFPKGQEIKEGYLEEVYAVNEQGKKISLRQVNSNTFEFVAPKERPYTLCARVRPGFLTKTTEGYKHGSKKGLQEVLSCFRYDIRTKAMVRAGVKGPIPEQRAGDPLEILALTDPLALKKGQTLPVKVLFEGKPLANAEIHFTWAGLSKRPHSSEHSVRTDKTGVAQIILAHEGEWMINVMHQVPYPDLQECDTYRYNASLSFHVDN